MDEVTEEMEKKYPWLCEYSSQSKDELLIFNAPITLIVVGEYFCP